MAREIGETVDEDELRAMVDEFDTNGDGESKLFNLTFVERHL